MAQQVVIAGAMFEDVPSISVPDANNVYHPFLDTTIASNAATASDIAQGKLAYVNGSLVTGTNQGGSATLITKSITANGTYNASSDSADGYSSVTVNVSGGGGSGLVYETGIWTPVEDVTDYDIEFSNTHSVPPFFACITLATGYDSTLNSQLNFYYVNYEGMCGCPIYASSTSLYYGVASYTYRATNATSTSGSSINITYPLSNTETTSANRPRYWATETHISAHSRSASRYFRANKPYKWIAVWAPTS